MLFEGAAGWNPHIYLPLIILIFSMVQSLVGVGLLLFGTPTLMLLGISFGSTLGMLLPCSIAVSLCQLQTGLPRNREVLFRIMYITLPMLILGLLTALTGLNTRWMPMLIGVALLGLGILRISPQAMLWLNRMITDYQRLYLAMMGLIHGLSNMGGGLLVAFAGTVSDSKNEARKIIALVYLMFAFTQLITLAIYHLEYLQLEYAYLPVISVVAYRAGNRIFKRLSAIQFSRLVTSLVLTYGLITISKALL